MTWWVGWIVPAVMTASALVAAALGHRWRGPMFIGTLVGGGFAVLSWFVIRHALGQSPRAGEVIFLQIVFSTAGIFFYGVSAMLAAKWMSRGRHTR